MFNLAVYFYLKKFYLFICIMKILTDFRETVETGMDLITKAKQK